MGELRVLAGAEGGVNREKGQQPVLELGPFPGAGGTGEDLEARVNLQGIGRYRAGFSPDGADARPGRSPPPSCRRRSGRTARSERDVARGQYRAAMPSLAASTALITGATGGIGQAIARALQ